LSDFHIDVLVVYLLNKTERKFQKKENKLSFISIYKEYLIDKRLLKVYQELDYRFDRLTMNYEDFCLNEY